MNTPMQTFLSRSFTARSYEVMRDWGGLHPMMTGGVCGAAVALVFAGGILNSAVLAFTSGGGLLCGLVASMIEFSSPRKAFGVLAAATAIGASAGYMGTRQVESFLAGEQGQVIKRGDDKYAGLPTVSGDDHAVTARLTANDVCKSSQYSRFKRISAAGDPYMILRNDNMIRIRVKCPKP